VSPLGSQIFYYNCWLSYLFSPQDHNLWEAGALSSLVVIVLGIMVVPGT